MFKLFGNRYLSGVDGWTGGTPFAINLLFIKHFFTWGFIGTVYTPVHPYTLFFIGQEHPVITYLAVIQPFDDKTTNPFSSLCCKTGTAEKYTQLARTERFFDSAFRRQQVRYLRCCQKFRFRIAG